MGCHMQSNEIDRKPLSLVWQAGFLGDGAALGFWIGLGLGGGLSVLVVAAALALAVIVGTVWQFRAQAARRLEALLDAYARREIARVRRDSPQRGAKPLAARRGLLAKSSGV